jgi:hypothetical protein
VAMFLLLLQCWPALLVAIRTGTRILAVFDLMPSVIPSVYTRGDGGPELTRVIEQNVSKDRPAKLVQACYFISTVCRTYCNTCSVLCEVRGIGQETLQIERC